MPAQDPKQSFVYCKNVFLFCCFNGAPLRCLESDLAREPRQPSQPGKPAKAVKTVETPFWFLFLWIYGLQQIDPPPFSSDSNLCFADVYIVPAESTCCLEN